MRIWPGLRPHSLSKLNFIRICCSHALQSRAHSGWIAHAECYWLYKWIWLYVNIYSVGNLTVWFFMLLPAVFSENPSIHANSFMRNVFTLFAAMIALINSHIRHSTGQWMMWCAMMKWNIWQANFSLFTGYINHTWIHWNLKLINRFLTNFDNSLEW